MRKALYGEIMNCLSPSILSADFGHLADQVMAADRAGAHYIHFDVMDGCFVPNYSLGTAELRAVRKVTDKILDVHLMIADPGRSIDLWADAGADIITIHAEATNHLDADINKIKDKGLLAGVAINPATPLEEILWVLDKVDMVLIMTVNPGFGGQKLIPYCLDKVRKLRRIIAERGLDCDIEVDGGMSLDNLEEVLSAGANIIVAGSAIFPDDVEENVEAFLAQM